jgi:hypothetical protein
MIYLNIQMLVQNTLFQNLKTKIKIEEMIEVMIYQRRYLVQFIHLGVDLIQVLEVKSILDQKKLMVPVQELINYLVVYKYLKDMKKLLQIQHLEHLIDLTLI